MVRRIRIKAKSFRKDVKPGRGKVIRRVKRKGYYKRDVGRPGRGPKLIPKLKEGKLSSHGYRLSDPDVGRRRRGLIRAVRATPTKRSRDGDRISGATSVFKRLNALAVFNKPGPGKDIRLYQRAESDKRWVKNRYRLG